MLTLRRSGSILWSPAQVSRKREFSWIRVETFGSSWPKKFEHMTLETILDEKSLQLAGLSHRGKKFLRKQEWLAGAGGIEPPNGGIKIRCLTAWLRPNRPERGKDRSARSPPATPVYRGSCAISTAGRPNFRPKSGLVALSFML